MTSLDGTLPGNFHTRWSAALTPIAEIAPGEVLEIAVPDSSTEQLSARSRSSALARLDFSKVDAAVGPIRVTGARPGDTLRVTFERIEPASWGWSGVFRKFGFLQDRFDDDLVIWKVGKRKAHPRSGFLRPVEIPVRPMLGIVAVAPAIGEYPMIPPQRFGGNMDNKLVGPGATVELPVEVDGALLSLADPHAAQGDGEVCGTGIETPALVSLHVDLVHGKSAPFPRLVGRLREAPITAVTAAMGIAPDLLTACRLALENMMALLGDRGLSEKEAYLVCSVAGDLRLSELVDAPNYLVSMVLPTEIIDSIGK